MNPSNPLTNENASEECIRRLRGLSRYADRLIERRPELIEVLRDNGPVTREAIDAVLAGASRDEEPEFKRRLRRLRQEVLLRTMHRDLSGRADLTEVCAAMSELADASIGEVIAWHEPRLVERYGRPTAESGAPQQLVVVAMGKLGGRELNVSSDIDLVFLYPEEGETDGPQKISNHEFFSLLGRRLIATLSEANEEGFVFRVDMRLRPYGESGPLVASFDALEAYLLAQGREWERYAWLKARALRPGIAEGEPDPAGRALDQLIRPFVFRKYLDYATLAAMRKLHAEVRREVARRDLIDHVKLGPGGIREIEFIVQALQLVRGGRDPALTVRPTLQALARLTGRRALAAETARELEGAYVFLRRLEHRLQYLDDAQTHSLPGTDDDRQRIAQMCGCTSWDAFAAQLADVRACVTGNFQDLFAELPEAASSGAWQDDRDAAAKFLSEKGFRDPEGSATRLAVIRASTRYQMLPADSRQRFDALVPALADAAAGTPDPDSTLARGLTLIETIARRAAYLALLAEHPEALERVARIIAASSWAADFVTRHPLLLDELLDDRMLYAAPDWPAFADSLRTQLAAQAGDVEQEMNLLREQHQAQVFRLLAQDLAGLLTVEHLADHLSALADIALQVTLDALWAQFRGRHREDAPGFAVIAYGKLGGKELGYASDLDIIFVYEDAHERAAEVYARLAQRFNHWLTARTSAGALFETDLRLRPSGVAGLMVSSLDAFARYQEESAWLWEHQALTRARYSAGDPKVGAAFEAIRERILRRPREADVVAREVRDMRLRLRAAHPNHSAEFDLKHDAGGMIDIEFAVQCLVLTHAHRHPELTGNAGNIALLGMAAGLGMIDQAICDGAQAAYREFRHLQHGLRLSGAAYARVPPKSVESHIGAVLRLWKAVVSSE